MTWNPLRIMYCVFYHALFFHSWQAALGSYRSRALVQARHCLPLQCRLL
jgi:hypothetical protein